MRGPYHTETRLLICSANQWTGFYMIETSVTRELTYGKKSPLFLFPYTRLETFFACNIKGKSFGIIDAHIIPYIDPSTDLPASF